MRIVCAFMLMISIAGAKTDFDTLFGEKVKSVTATAATRDDADLGAEILEAAGSVADMDFKAPPAVLEALQRRLDHGVFGYEAVPDGLVPALTGWLHARHGWQVDEDHVLRAPNVLNALAIAASLFTNEGDGVIVQPPVFFDFFDILRENRRALVPNPLILEEGRYRMDFEDLERNTFGRLFGRRREPCPSEPA